MQCCGSEMFFILDPGSVFSSILDPGFRISNAGSWIQREQKKDGKKYFCLNFFSSQEFHKIEDYFLRGTKNLNQLANYLSIFHFLNIVIKLSETWVWDPGSGKISSRVPDSGVKRALDPISGSATLPSPKCWQISHEVLPGSSVWCISTATAMCMAVG